MNASNLIVNFAIRSRNSSNPKLMLGRESAIEGASAEERGGRIALVERETDYERMEEFILEPAKEMRALNEIRSCA